MLRTAIIPTRGGSTRVPRKNLRPLAGKPLLTYIVQAAKSSKILSDVILSTDDDEIANVAISLDIEVFRHPKELSTDSSSSFGVIQWALTELIRQGREPAVCALIRATSPLCLPHDIDHAIELLESNDHADSVVSVTKMSGVHPKKLKTLLPNSVLVDAFEPEGFLPTRRQTLPPLYIRNAAIYVSTPSLIANGMLWGPRCLGYVMPEERSVNINSEIDFKLAEVLIKEGVDNE